MNVSSSDLYNENYIKDLSDSKIDSLVKELTEQFDEDKKIKIIYWMN